MKKITLFLCIFFIFGCQSQKKVYWCGDHPCINKKEKKAYFKKNMVVEVRKIGKNYKRNDSEMEKIIAQAKLTEKKRIKDEKDFAKQMRLEEKSRIKEEKKLTKQARLEEKRRIKDEKDLAKLNRSKEKKRKKQIVNKKEKEIIISSEIGAIDISEFKTTFEKVVKKNSTKPYPDINNIPE
jgi:hypothetical protein